MLRTVHNVFRLFLISNSFHYFNTHEQSLTRKLQDSSYHRLLIQNTNGMINGLTYDSKRHITIDPKILTQPILYLKKITMCFVWEIKT